MRRTARDILLDTGPLVAVLDRADQWHDRCAARWPALVHRCVTTEAVVTEACHLVLAGGGPAHAALDFLLAAEIPIVGLDTPGHRRAATLMRRFADTPMDFADAALVVLSDALRTADVFTTDRRGFSVYEAPNHGRFRMYPEV